MKRAYIAILTLVTVFVFAAFASQKAYASVEIPVNLFNPDGYTDYKFITHETTNQPVLVNAVAACLSTNNTTCSGIETIIAVPTGQGTIKDYLLANPNAYLYLVGAGALNGTYYINWYDQYSSPNFGDQVGYSVVTTDGTQWSNNYSTIVDDTTTHFIDTQLNIASTTDVTLTYYVNAADLASTTASGGLVKFHSYINGLDTGWQSQSTDFYINTSGLASTTYSVPLTHAGLYHLYASIYAVDTYGSIGQVFTSTTTDFTFVSDYYTSIFGTTTPADQGIPYVTCSALQVYGCIQNAFIYLLYPSADSMGILMFSEFKEIMYKKPPVGYFSMIKQAMSNVNASSTGAITGWVIPAGIVTAFFTPVSTAVTGILGFFILIQFYKRFKDVDLKG